MISTLFVRCAFLSLILTTACVLLSPSIAIAEQPISALMLDGQLGNHPWRGTSPLLKKTLEDTGRFQVQVFTFPPHKKIPASKRRPDFSSYDVVIFNYKAPTWPDDLKESLDTFVRSGGGLVIVHSANNAFPNWPEFNRMIGLGGWGDRSETEGVTFRWRDGQMVRDATPCTAGAHGEPHEFLIDNRNPKHPIMRGLPTQWLHSKDELYERLRGPAESMTVLATAFADPRTGGSGENEPMLWTVDYGKGRVFHSVLGHDLVPLQNIGYQTTLVRGTEWAATGNVTLPVPKNFPTPEHASTHNPMLGDKPAASDRSVTAEDLRCEYLKNPLGIDVRRPRLSWKLAAIAPTARGLHQTAYEVLVASSPEKLKQNQGDLWSSGVVESDQSIHVVYRGATLTSSSPCCWKVRVRDQDGNFSAWSTPASWTMGLLDASDWSARWIGCDQTFSKIENVPPEDNYLADPWFRKVVTLDDKPTRATISIASVGYHELYVNGEKVDDTVLAPCVSDHTKRARYVTYDITKQLHAGRNLIGLWLGTSWSVFPLYKTDDKPQTPIVIAQAEIDLPNRETLRVGTDASWKTHPSPNVLLGTWMFRDFGGEFYDASKEVSDWNEPEFDDSAWQAATLYEPKLTLSAEMIEPNRRIKEIRPVSIKAVGQGEYRVDMGVNFVGFLELDVKGNPGDVVEFLISEHVDQAMTHSLHNGYRIGPDGRGTFRNRFNYISGRWVQIKGLSYQPRLSDIRGFMVRTDFERAATFECSDKLLCDINEITQWTFENLSLGGYVVDCQQRERMGYGGDAHATTQSGLNNYRMGAFYTKWTQDWRDVQGKSTSWGLSDNPKSKQQPEVSGNLPYTAPTYWGGGGPAWSGICITMPWHVYLRCGDQRILEENFPMMQRWLAFLETKTKDDMLVRWGGEWDFLGDWLWPGASGVNGDTRETLFFNNCYWIHSLQSAAKIADILGETDTATSYRLRSETIRKAVHQEFFDPETNGYVNNLQAYLAIALLVDLPPEELRPAVWKRFEEEILVHRQGHFWGGITGGYFIVKTLLENNRSDLMYEMATKTDYPSWGNMLRQGATTVWEAWSDPGSRMHSSFLHIGSWFIEGLAGIRPDPEAPGYKRFILQPGVFGGASPDWVKASYESPYGNIRIEWRMEENHFEVAATIPSNSTAILRLPTCKPASVREGGLPATDAVGVRFLGVEGRYALFELLSGEFVFRAEQCTP